MAAQVTSRKARLSDVPAMQRIVNGYAEHGLMLPRPLVMLYEGLRDFVVLESEGQLIAIGALHVVWDDLAEIRSLAVAPGFEGRGFGREIVNALLDEARSLGVGRVFALTYKQGFFEKLGFHVVSKDALPHKVWGDCLNCPKFPNCDEIAVERRLA